MNRRLNYSNTHDILPKLQNAEISVGRALVLLNRILEEQDETRISEIRKTNLNPDDVLLVTVKNDHLDSDSVQNLSRLLKKHFPHNKVAIFGIGLDDSVKFDVVSNKSDVVQSHCADCTCGKKELAQHNSCQDK